MIRFGSLLVSAAVLCTLLAMWVFQPTKVQEPQVEARVWPDRGWLICEGDSKDCDKRLRESHGMPVPEDKPMEIIDSRPALQTALAEEIARSEGFFDKKTLPAFLHNPGALVYAGQSGAELDRTSCLPCPCDGFNEKGEPVKLLLSCGGSQYAQFPTDEAGWAALHRDIAAKWRKWDDTLLDKQEETRAFLIAYHWTSPPNEQYASRIIARLKKRGLIQ